MDDDVAVELQRLQKTRHAPFKRTLNTVLRTGLAALSERRVPKRSPYRTAPVSLGNPRLTNVDNISEVLSFAEGEDHR